MFLAADLLTLPTILIRLGLCHRSDRDFDLGLAGPTLAEGVGGFFRLSDLRLDLRDLRFPDLELAALSSGTSSVTRTLVLFDNVIDIDVHITGNPPILVKIGVCSYGLRNPGAPPSGQGFDARIHYRDFPLRGRRCRRCGSRLPRSGIPHDAHLSARGKRHQVPSDFSRRSKRLRCGMVDSFVERSQHRSLLPSSAPPRQDGRRAGFRGKYRGLWGSVGSSDGEAALARPIITAKTDGNTSKVVTVAAPKAADHRATQGAVWSPPSPIPSAIGTMPAIIASWSSRSDATARWRPDRGRRPACPRGASAPRR